ncbi:MAG TPA: cephalosporin hydroxylase [Coxiellaceae bacterium]|nr:cephalosporin hydroxylase [Coxiellaceae bacterium]
MFDRKKFDSEKEQNIRKAHADIELNKAALNFITVSDRFGYAYNWTWLDLPIIQMPEDIILVQEIIWKTKPDIIIETGIAWGGSVVLYASILELIGKGQVLAIDKVLPQNNIDEIMKYNFSNRIKLFEGSSTDKNIVESISSYIKATDKIMILLDSNHSHEHVYNELKIWSPFVTLGNYLVVSDTVVEEIPEQIHRSRPWGHGNNPMTALNQFLLENKKFTRDNEYNYKANNSYTRNGYVKCL